MGIRGLYSYIQTFVDDALEWHKLCNCILIIDGNNLAYDIYYQTQGINSAYGGDYDKYAANIEDFIRKLYQCKVKPYVIMDGGNPVQRDKFSVMFSRLNENLETCLTISPKNQHLFRLFPILGRSVFVNVLQRLGVDILQCDFEADDEIVVIAKKMGGYVLSNDSDFFLFDVPFILLSSLNLKQIQREKEENGSVIKFIPCFKFSLQKFCEITNIREELVPLLASTLGNDYFDPRMMRYFYQHLDHLQPKTAPIRKRQKIIISVVKWLATQTGSREKVIEKIGEMCCLREYNAVIKKLKSVINMYSPTTSSIDSWFLSHDPICPLAGNKLKLPNFASMSASKVDYKDKTFLPPKVKWELDCICKERIKTEIISSGDLPEWFVKSFRLNLVPSIAADILNKAYCFTVPQIECKDRKSLYLRFELLLKRMRAILWTSYSRALKIRYRAMKSKNQSAKKCVKPTLTPSKNGFFLKNLEKSGSHEINFIQKHDINYQEKVTESFNYEEENNNEKKVNKNNNNNNKSKKKNKISTQSQYDLKNRDDPLTKEYINMLVFGSKERVNSNSSNGKRKGGSSMIGGDESEGNSECEANEGNLNYLSADEDNGNSTNTGGDSETEVTDEESDMENMDEESETEMTDEESDTRSMEEESESEDVTGACSSEENSLSKGVDSKDTPINSNLSVIDNESDEDSFHDCVDSVSFIEFEKGGNHNKNSLKVNEGIKVMTEKFAHMLNEPEDSLKKVAENKGKKSQRRTNEMPSNKNNKKHADVFVNESSSNFSENVVSHKKSLGENPCKANTQCNTITNGEAHAKGKSVSHANSGSKGNNSSAINGHSGVETKNANNVKKGEEKSSNRGDTKNHVTDTRVKDNNTGKSNTSEGKKGQLSNKKSENTGDKFEVTEEKDKKTSSNSNKKDKEKAVTPVKKAKCDEGNKTKEKTKRLSSGCKGSKNGKESSCDKAEGNLISRKPENNNSTNAVEDSEATQGSTKRGERKPKKKKNKQSGVGIGNSVCDNSKNKEEKRGDKIEGNQSPVVKFVPKSNNNKNADSTEKHNVNEVSTKTGDRKLKSRKKNKRASKEVTSDENGKVESKKNASSQAKRAKEDAELTRKLSRKLRVCKYSKVISPYEKRLKRRKRPRRKKLKNDAMHDITIPEELVGIDEIKKEPDPKFVQIKEASKQKKKKRKKNKKIHEYINKQFDRKLEKYKDCNIKIEEVDTDFEEQSSGDGKPKDDIEYNPFKVIPSVRWFVREGTRLQAKNMAKEYIDVYKDLPCLFDVESMSSEEKRNALLRILDIKLDLNSSEEIPRNLEFILICMIYWRKKVCSVFDYETALSFIMCILMFFVIDGKGGRIRTKRSFESYESYTKKARIIRHSKNQSSSMSIASLIQCLTFEECQLANVALYQFHENDCLVKKGNFNRSVVHAFSEYQATIYYLNLLNSLLLFPYPAVSVESIWSGTFSYNIMNIFKCGLDVSFVLFALFGKNIRIINLFVKLYNLLEKPLDLPPYEDLTQEIPIENKNKTLSVLRKRLDLKCPFKNGFIAKKRIFKPEKYIQVTSEPNEEFGTPSEEDLTALAENKFSALLIS